MSNDIGWGAEAPPGGWWDATKQPGYAEALAEREKNLQAVMRGPTWEAGGAQNTGYMPTWQEMAQLNSSWDSGRKGYMDDWYQNVLKKVGSQDQLNKYINQYSYDPNSFAGFKAANPNWQYSYGGSWKDLQGAMNPQPTGPLPPTAIGGGGTGTGPLPPTGPGTGDHLGNPTGLPIPGASPIGQKPINWQTYGGGQGGGMGMMQPFNSFKINPNQFQLGKMTW